MTGADIHRIFDAAGAALIAAAVLLVISHVLWSRTQRRNRNGETR